MDEKLPDEEVNIDPGKTEKLYKYIGSTGDTRSFE